MNCESCGEDKNEYALIPKRQPDGRLDTITCIDCAKSLGMYCQKHSSPHLGFTDETTACRDCIEEVVKNDGEKIASEFLQAVVTSEHRYKIHSSVSAYLNNLMSVREVDLVDLNLTVLFRKSSLAENIIRPVVTYAARMKVSPEEIIEQIKKEGPDKVFPELNS